jgi:hypothetical protein
VPTILTRRGFYSTNQSAECVTHRGDQDDEETVNPRALERLRQCLTARYASEVKQNTRIKIWIHRAVETEMPMPVNNAI